MLRFVSVFLFALPLLHAQSVQVTLPNGDRLLDCSADDGTCSSLFTAGADGLTDPQRVTIGADDRLYVSSTASNQIFRMQPDGRFIEVFVAAGSGGLAQPLGLAFGPDGHLYVASSGSGEILRFDGASGAFMDAFVSAGSGGLANPVSLTFSTDGMLYVLSNASANVLRFDGATGAFVDEFLTPNAGGMQNPQWLAFGPTDLLYVTDASLNQVLRFDPVSRLLWDTFASPDLSQPAAACFAQDGSLYVASFGNNRVLKMSANGAVEATFNTSSGPTAVTCPIGPENEIATTLLYPWVSKNQGFESIIVAHNYSDFPAQFRLTARRASGPAEVVTRTVPANGFLRETAGDLFPISGDGAGYAVLLESTVAQTSGVWVTNNLTAASGMSPAQGVAVEIPADLAQASERWGQRIAYGFLPITDGLTSAPVVVNLGSEPTDVVLQFYDTNGTLLREDRDTLQNLTPLRPFAAVVNQLAPQDSGDVYIIAYSETQPLTGVSFVFNSGGEPAIGNVTAVDDRFAPVNQKVAWLQDQGFAIASTDPADDDDFSDLQHLAAELEGVRVLMLGEQTHGDGTTFLAKTRLIKYLHQELGYEVLAFEGGLYGGCKAWQAYVTGEDPQVAFAQGNFSIFSDSQQLQPLIEYLAQTITMGNPLKLAGMDSQFSGNAAAASFVSDLESFLNGLGATATSGSDWESVRGELQGLTESRFVNEGPPSSAVQQTFFSVLADARDEARALSGESPDPNQRYWIQILSNVAAHAHRSWLFDYQNRSANTTTIRNLRDQQMGENLIWLANEMYPDQKIIVWAATYHIARNMPAHFREAANGEPFYQPNQITMGDVVYDALGNQVYAMGFTAKEGSWGTIFSGSIDLAESEPQDLEGLFSQAGYTNGFISFRNAEGGGQWLRNPLVSRPLGYVRVGADWSQVLDGMVYTQTMVPSTNVNGKRKSTAVQFHDLRVQ